MPRTSQPYSPPLALATRSGGRDGEAWQPKTCEGTAHAAILVADVRGFSSISRRLGARASAAFLNRLFAATAPCIEDQGGIIDTFIGDAILAVFGPPGADDAPEDFAVRAAIAIQRTLRRFNRTFPPAGGAAIAMGIGIHSGEVFFGPVGSPGRAVRTVIGPSVNAAFALEKTCKRFRSGILVSAAARRRLEGRYVLRLLDAPEKGAIAATAPLYEVLDQHTEATFPHLREALRAYHRGLAAFRAGRSSAAAQAFAAALTLNADDPLFRYHAERCDGQAVASGA